MAENKTKPTEQKAESFIEQNCEGQKKEDALRILESMKKITGEKPTMWGPSLIGFGTYHYKYASGREGDFFCVGFSPRKTALTVYIMPGFKRYDSLMQKLGKYKTGKSCLYIKKLTDVDYAVLEELIGESYQHMNGKSPTEC